MSITYQDGTPFDVCGLFPELCRTTIQPTVSMTTLPNGTPQVRVGGTTLDKLLSTLLSGIALAKGAGYVPTTQQPQQQYDYAALLQQQSFANQQALGNGNTGATFGAGIETFVKQNFTLLAIGGAALVLFKSGRK